MACPLLQVTLQTTDPGHTFFRPLASASKRELPGSAFVSRRAIRRNWAPPAGRGRPSSRRRSSLVVVAASGRRWFHDGRQSGLGDSIGEFGPYPWQRQPGDTFSDVEEEPQTQRISFVTSEGVFTLNSRPLLVQSEPDLSGEGAIGPLRRRQRRVEEEYMDPMQQLCLGALFDIKALNGVSRGRMFCIDGFCRSVHMLSDVIADAVAEEGGEILAADVRSSSGLNERLQMTIVLPLLWGVPPKRDTLRKAVHQGGGIVHRCFQEWQFY